MEEDRQRCREDLQEASNASVVGGGGRADSPLRAETTSWVGGGVQRTARPSQSGGCQARGSGYPRRASGSDFGVDARPKTDNL